MSTVAPDQAKKPRLLFLVTLSEWGGAQHIVYLLAKYLYNGYEVTVACAPGGELIWKLQQEQIRVAEIDSLRRNPHLWHDLRAFWRLYRLMKKERFEIVHTHSTKAGLLGRLAARWAGVPVVLFTAHGWAFTEGRSAWKRRALAWVERFAARYANKIICVSEHDRRLALEFGVAHPEKLMVIHNGLDPRPFLQADGTGRIERPFAPTPTLLFVGRLAHPKDPLSLLKALRLLPEVKLLFVGDGPLRQKMERWAAQHHLRDRVCFMGKRRDIPEILASSDVFVLTSRWEGLPLVIIEAMLAALPVVATDVGGVRELVEEGVTGLLVPPGDLEVLVGALQKLLADEALRRQMGRAGRKRALERFTLERMMEEHQKLIGSLKPAAKKRP